MSCPECAVRETDGLTDRQIEILRLVTMSYSSKEIGAMLDITTKTVETHREQISKRLNIHDTAALTRYAIRKGLITAEE
jgi:DNA-binding NarL/FixJ family response regulator